MTKRDLLKKCIFVIGGIILTDNKKNKFSVIKSNRLITAQFKMDLNEQKIILLCIAKIKEGTQKSDEKEESLLKFSFTTKEIKTFLNLDSNSRGIYTELKTIADKLTRHRICIQNGDDFCFIVPIPFCEYKKSIFTIRFDRAMEEYLLELKDKFTMYSIENIRTLRSNYSIRIYELLKSYEWLGEKVFELDDFKKMIGIKLFNEENNEWQDLYFRYADVKRRAIVPAQEELLEKTDIHFEFEEIKTGRKVTSLKFKIFKNSSANEIEALDDLVCAVKLFIEEPLQEKEIELLLETANNDVELIKQKYWIAKQQKHINNLLAWLIVAITE